MSLGFDPARKVAFSPSSLATAVNQAVGNLLISSIESKLPTLVNGAFPVIIAPPGTNGQIAYNNNGIFAGATLGSGLSIINGVLTLTGAAGLVRVDVVDPSTIYVGKAATGTAESATGWTIKLTTYSAFGVLLTTATATGAWSNRASLSYS